MSKNDHNQVEKLHKLNNYYDIRSISNKFINKLFNDYESFKIPNNTRTAIIITCIIYIVGSSIFIVNYEPILDYDNLLAITLIILIIILSIAPMIFICYRTLKENKKININKQNLLDFDIAVTDITNKNYKIIDEMFLYLENRMNNTVEKSKTIKQTFSAITITFGSIISSIWITLAVEHPENVPPTILLLVAIFMCLGGSIIFVWPSRIFDKQNYRISYAIEVYHDWKFNNLYNE